MFAFAALARRGLSAVLTGFALLAFGGAIHAQSLYKCVDTHGTTAYQVAPCPSVAQRSSVIVLQPSLPVDETATRPDIFRNAVAHGTRALQSQRTSAPRQRVRKAAHAQSWECRAANGEVFYRHTRCPHSVLGDGIARFGADQSHTGPRHGRRHSRDGAWSAVPVTARKISRAEACRAIGANAAAGRDGHARDEQVSVYDHNLGRDPCRGY